MALYLSDIVSVAGKPGLHQVIGKRPTGLIVESLENPGQKFPTSLTQKVSFLSDISIYTYEGDESLANVLQLLDKAVNEGLELISKKNSGDEIRAFFRKVLENFDEEQVYNSDIIKLVNWYELLKPHVDFNQLEKPEEDTKEKAGEAKPKAGTANKAAKKPAPKAQTKAKGGAKKSGNLKSGKS